MQKVCTRCGEQFAAARKDVRYCSKRCRNSASRDRVAGKPDVLPDLPAVMPVVSGNFGAALAELTAAGREDSSAGQAALTIARRMDEGAESSAGLAALSRELRAAMAEALSRVESSGDALDDLRARREARRAV